MKRKEFVVSSKTWNKFMPEIQEKLCERYDVILTGHSTKKEKALSIFKKLDITTKEGQDAFEYYTGMIDKGFKKVDSIFEELDTALSKIGGPKTKSLLDDPWGKGSIGNNLQPAKKKGRSTKTEIDFFG